ncbi:hypothetical protein JGZ11_05165 [Staphylococcus pseudintermedius]|nr:hypothetical protein [Staphylococcus pseudintermedius]QQJ54150.1 hypothetical protein JGZ11_05165 [Staphylococcus pseudintermedius]
MRENDNEQQPKEQQEMHQNKQIDDGQRASSYRTSPPQGNLISHGLK